MFEFLVLYGRRRVGKTELLKEFSAGRNTEIVKFIHASLMDVNGRCTVIVCTKATLRTDIFMPVPVP